jgi:proline racemase
MGQSRGRADRKRRRHLGAIEAVDYHTAGEPFRIVTGGVPPLEGRTILEKRRFAGERLDHVRRLLVHEPRGHADMYGCFVTEPEDDGADLGVVFFHNAGYSTACGHGTIALVTWALESGRLDPGEDERRVVVDVPSGRLETVARVEDGRVTAVRFRNVPSFVVARDLEAAGLTADVAFGGAFYASVQAPIPVAPESVTRLIELGRDIKHELEAQKEYVHPLGPELRDIYGVIFWQAEEDGPPLVQRNVTVFADGEVDRSPCGSGTSARLALLDATGELPRGQELRHLSVIGTEFRARVVGDADVTGLPAVITEVEGSAHYTGHHEFALDSSDPLPDGFLLR